MAACALYRGNKWYLRRFIDSYIWQRKHAALSLSHMLQDLGRKRNFLIVWGNCTIVVGLPGGCAKGHKAEYIVWGVFHLSQNWYLIYLAEKAEYIVWKVFHLYQFNLISNLSNRVWSVRAEYFIWNWLIFVLKFYPEVHLIRSRVCQEWLPRMTRLNILNAVWTQTGVFKTYLEM